MSRYIDADNLIERIFEITGKWAFTYTRNENDVIEDIVNIINEQPTADVVGVTRCEDCRFGQYDLEDQGYMEPPTCEGIICSKHKGLYMDFTDYCSYGERKGGAK